MGITIFAQGKLKGIEVIPRLIEYIKSTAGEYGWKYHVINDDFDARLDAALSSGNSEGCSAHIKGSLGLKGIVLNIDPGSEPLAVLFDQTGVLTDMLQQLAWIQNNKQGERFTVCKTQFGNIDTHIRIVELLDELKQSYIDNLVVSDEGGYWESRDRRLLAEKRVFLGQCLRRVEKVISGIEISDEEPRNADALAERIEEALLKSEDDDGLHYRSAKNDHAD
jgi:hypothetical protein